MAFSRQLGLDEEDFSVLGILISSWVLAAAQRLRLHLPHLEGGLSSWVPWPAASVPGAIGWKVAAGDSEVWLWPGACHGAELTYIYPLLSLTLFFR